MTKFRSVSVGLLLVAVFFGCDLFCGNAVAQNPDSPPRNTRRPPDPFGGKMPPAGTVSIIGRSVIKSAATGGSNNIPLMAAVNDERVRKDLGLSDEQVGQLKTIRDEINAQVLLKGSQYVLRFQKMTPEDAAKIEQDLSGEIKSFTNRIQSVATPEQLQKSRTLVFQSIGGLDSPIANPDTLEALNLTDDQRKKITATMDSLEKERIELMEEGLRLAEKAVSLGGPNMSQEDRDKLRLEAQALEAKVFASGVKVGDAIRPFLTEEQKTLAVRLMANRPSYLPPLPRQLRGRVNVDEEYRPGPDSWQPGQGTPEDAKPRRGFPRANAKNVESESSPKE
ncbi:MAG: hypothetical protein ACRC46_01520 [Thermoguttaceae bacterium]